MRPAAALTILLGLSPVLRGADALESALSDLEEMRRAGTRKAVTITIPTGHYDRVLDLDAGLVGDGLILRAAGDGPVVLSAGMRIAKWKEENGQWIAPVDVPQILQLFIDGTPRPRARIPNDGYWRIAQTGPDRRTSFTWQGNTIPRIADLAHTELLFLHDWSITRVPVRSLDHEARILTTAFPIGPPSPHYVIDHYEKQPRFALEGARDFLDAPGEWHFDPKTKTLRYIPRAGETPGKVEAVVPVHPAVVKLGGTAAAPIKNVRFEGIEFAHAHWPPPAQGYAAGQATFHDARPDEGRHFARSAVEANYCEDVLFTKCTFAASTGGGLWIREGCRNVTVRECTFRQLGGNGLMIGQPENPPKTTTKVTVDRCRISHCGTRYFGAVGIWIGMAADCIVKNCEVSHLPYTGISAGWRWDPTPTVCKGHLIENNHIHHILQTLSDGGGIYTLGRQPGTVLRGNHIHHVSVNSGRSESNGIFMDEGTTDLLVEHNDIHDIARSPIRFHKAGKNLLRHNKLRPKDGVPVFRFNNTPEENITVEDPQ